MQLVMDCNTMAEELEKPVEFKTKLLSAEARGQENGRTEVLCIFLAELCVCLALLFFNQSVVLP